MKKIVYPFFKIGIIGGGQLGKMMAQSAKKMGFYVEILDPTPNCPASQVSDSHIIGRFDDRYKIEKICRRNDIITYDLEHIDTRSLKKSLNINPNIYPSPYTLDMIRDKFSQKKFLKENKFPTPSFMAFSDISELKELKLKFPMIQKSRFGGYDGKGVVLLNSYDDIKKTHIKNNFILEEKINIYKEIAVILARSGNGEIRIYNPCEMIFNNKANICDMVISPADIEPKLSKQAIIIAKSLVEKLNDCGVFAIEMFVSKDKKLYVNEIAPRPHNSGHYTIESCVTSQFEQHIRAICGLPLGSTRIISPSVMINLLGNENSSGVSVIEGLYDVLKIDDVSFHFYGKIITKPFRKMGHITIINKNLKKAVSTAKKIKKIIKITGKEQL